MLSLFLGAAVAALAPGCGAPGEAPLEGYDLVVINIDTLRADHLGFAGYERDTSPFLDRLAAEGVVFERATANSSYTRESVAALLTGRLPSRSGAAGWRASPPPSGPHLGPLLEAAGYRTAFLSNTVMLRHPGFTRGFDTVQHLPKRWDLSGAGPQLTARALAFARAAGPQPLAMYLHYLDPHGPYDPAPAFRARIPVAESEERLRLYEDVAPRLAELRAAGFGPGEARFEDWVARYDAEIAATDAAIEALFEGLAGLGRLDRTLVVVTADHGEEFLEHGGVEHGWTLHAESVRVPLLFWAPARLEPARIAVPVSQVDLLPTLAALLGLDAGPDEDFDAPDARFDGAALFAGVTPDPPPRPQIAELLLPERNALRSYTEDGWKYVAAHRFVPAQRRHGWSPPPEPIDWTAPPRREWLYHLEEDPAERNDLAAERPERLAQLRAALARSLGDARPPGAAPAPEIDPEEAERLRALGYH